MHWVIIRFPHYSEGSILSYRDRSLLLVSENEDEKQCLSNTSNRFRVAYDDDKAVWTLATPDVRICAAVSCGMIWTEKPQSVQCAEGLGISNGIDSLRLCISAASVAESCPSLSLELKNTARSIAASFECAICRRIESSLRPSPCGCSSIPSVVGTPFDYVIVGTSFCAYSFVHRAIANNPNVKILLVEKGDLFLLEHRQNPSTYSQLPIAESLRRLESRPWSFSASSSSLVTAVKGQMVFYGGRSTFWSGWCPEPSDDDLDGWPGAVRQSLRQYFGAARKLLSVTPANKIKSLHSDQLIYGPEFQEFLETRCRATDQASQVSPGSIAMAKDGSVY